MKRLGAASFDAQFRARVLVPLLSAMPLLVYGACPEPANSDRQLAAARRLQGEGKIDDAIDCQQHGIERLGATVRAAQEQLFLGELLERAGQMPASVAVQKLALSQIEKLTGPETEATADALWSLGTTEYFAAAHVDAERHLRRAYAIYVARLGTRHLKIAKVQNNLGLVLRDRIQYEEAEVVLTNALDIAANGETPDDRQRATIYNSLAGLWYYRGEYRRALEGFKSSLQIQERLQGEISSDVGKMLNNIGAVYEEIGEYESARTYYSRALAIQEKLLGPNHPTVAGPVNNLAVLAYAQNDYATAEPLFKRALQIYETSLGPNHPNVAQVLSKYGALKHLIGQDEAAAQMLERALQIHEAAFGPDNNWLALSLNELGPVYRALGKSDRAKDALVRSIGIAAAGDEPQTLLIAYHYYADVLAGGGETAAAVFYGKYAVNIAQQLRNEMSALGQAVQTSYLKSREHIYRNLADRLIQLGRLAEAEQVMTMLKEEEYFDFVRIAVRSADGGNTRADFSASERPIADELDRALQRLAANATTIRSLAENDKSLDPERAALAREQSELRLLLAATAKRLTSTTRPTLRNQTAERTRENVPPGSALVRYLTTAQRVRMIVTTHDATIDTEVAIELPALNRQVFELRQAMQNPTADFASSAKRLYELLIAPLQPTLSRNRVTSLQVDLDGPLRYVPFAALHDGNSFLVEHFDITQRTLSGAEYHGADTNGRRLAGFGVSKAIGGFAALPAVESELDRIVRRGPQDRDGVIPGVLIMDEAFTEASLRGALAGNYSLVHVASHFVSRPGPLTDSYLLLGNGDKLTLERLRDGTLSLANVQLLTLSACSTAMGEAGGGGGELESFGVLAQRLGAGEVLASLWPVADRSTSLLMLKLYRGLNAAPATTSKALQAAQLSLLRGDRGFAPYAHPFYWAPFVLMSSPRH